MMSAIIVHLNILFVNMMSYLGLFLFLQASFQTVAQIYVLVVSEDVKNYKI